MPINPAVLQNSNSSVNEQLMTAQQQLALAQALRGQSLQPIQAPGGQNGRISGLSVLAQALNGYTANHMMGDATHNLATAQAAQSQNYMAMMARMLDPSQGQTALAAPAGDAGPGPTPAPQASTPGQAAPAPAQAPQQPSPASAVQDPRSDPQFRQMAMAEQMGLLPQGTASAYAKAKYDYSAPTPEQRNSRDAVIGKATQDNLETQNMTEVQRLQRARGLLSPGDPKIDEIDKQIQKLNYVAPVSVAPGTLLMRADGSGPSAYNPPAIKGAVQQFQTRNGFTTAPNVAPQGGAAAVSANMEGAEQGAKEANSLKTVTNPDGSSTTNWGGRIAGITGPSTTDQAVQKSAADVVAQAPQIVQQSRGAANGLEAALRSLGNVKSTGPGTARTNEIVSAINNSLGTHIDGASTDAYQQVAKYLSNSLNSAVQGTGAGGSDARFESFMHGQPNNDTMNIEPLKGAIRYVLSQHDANAARGQFLQDAYTQAKTAGDPNAAMTAQAQWSKVYRPEFFAFNRMSPEEHVQYLKSLGPDGAKKFVQQYNEYSNQTGWVH